jgi:hypothetical protein
VPGHCADGEKPTAEKERGNDTITTTIATAEATSHSWGVGVFAACYAPVLAWGPLLAAVTVHYTRRRT